MSTALTLHQEPDTQLTSLKTYKKIRFLENQYRDLIDRISPHTEELIPLMQEMENVYTSIVKMIHGLIPDTQTADTAKWKLERYIKEVEDIHRDNFSWLTLYCDLTWPLDPVGKRRERLKRTKFRRKIKKNVELIWHELLEKQKLSMLDENTRQILYLKDHLKGLKVNSTHWRFYYDRLREKLFHQLTARLKHNKYALKNKFQIVIYSESIIEAIEKNMAREMTELNFLDHFSDRHLKTYTQKFQKIADWILGYVRFNEEETIKGHLLVNKLSVKGIKKYERSRVFSLVKKGILTGVVLSILGAVLYFSKIDDQIYQNILYNIQLIRNLDPASIILKQKKDFFNQEIENINVNYSQADILFHTRHFVTEEVYKEKFGYIYFAENILKGYLLLITDKKADNTFREEVVNAANLLNPALAQNLYDITLLYSQRIIRERAFRYLMLNLRREFVSHNVFPFMFLVLRNDIPYLLVYPEEILYDYILDDAAAVKLGIDIDRYKKEAPWPVAAHVVEGDKYPLRDRAGYFEGEFAVIFKSLSDRVDWTAYHETGHVVDKLRSGIDKIGIPKNMELNAMLFPIIFTEDRIDYINQSLIPRALRADPYDYYAQASRGILNAYVRYFLKEDSKKLKEALITRKFEKKRIERIQNKLNSTDSQELRQITFDIYNNPGEYLPDVSSGRYITQTMGAEEVILGAHTVTQRGFILEGYGGSLFGDGPIFLRQGFGFGEDSDVPFSFSSFMRRVLRVVLFRKDRAELATEPEAVVAAVLFFILFESFAVFFHKISGPYRRRKFYGTSLKDTVNAIYRHNGWSDGLSYGGEINERLLLQEIFDSFDGAQAPPFPSTFARDGEHQSNQKAGIKGAAQSHPEPIPDLQSGDSRRVDCKGKITPEVLDKLYTFKALASDRQRALLDVCLCLASFNPKRSDIKNKLHDLIFFLPYLGPYLGRAPWIWPAQKLFYAKEEYNLKIAALAQSLAPETSIESFLNNFRKAVDSYKSRDVHQTDQKEIYKGCIDALQSYVQQFLKEDGNVYRQDARIIYDRKNSKREEGTDFNGLDKYYHGDDIRRIDWNVTARSVNREAMVRRYYNSDAIRVGLLLDMRYISLQNDQKKWAEDFVKTIKVLDADSTLEWIVFVHKNGSIQESACNIKAGANKFKTVTDVFMHIHKEYQRVLDSALHMEFPGLQFYTSDENELFKRNVNLSDFGNEPQYIKPAQITAKNTNIFLVGVKIERQIELTSLNSESNQWISWQ